MRPAMSQRWLLSRRGKLRPDASDQRHDAGLVLRPQWPHVSTCELPDGPGLRPWRALPERHLRADPPGSCAQAVLPLLHTRRLQRRHHSGPSVPRPCGTRFLHPALRPVGLLPQWLDLRPAIPRRPQAMHAPKQHLSHRLHHRRRVPHGVCLSVSGVQPQRRRHPGRSLRSHALQRRALVHPHGFGQALYAPLWRTSRKPWRTLPA